MDYEAVIFRNRGRFYFDVQDNVTDTDAKRSLERAYDDLIDAGVAVFDDPRLSIVNRNAVMKAVAFSERTINDISDALAPLDWYDRGLVLLQFENMLRESAAVAYAVAIIDATAVVKAAQAEAMRAARTSPERERAIEEAIACSDPATKKRVNHIIADVAKAGFSIGPDAVRERLKKAGS